MNHVILCPPYISPPKNGPVVLRPYHRGHLADVHRTVILSLQWTSSGWTQAPKGLADGPTVPPCISSPDSHPRSLNSIRNPFSNRQYRIPMEF